MRHRKKFNHLSRTSSHRKAMLSNMASSLIMHKRIHTTLAKAKALRIYIEPLITKSKDDTTHSRRVVFSYLQSKEAVTELFREVSVKVAERPGGYTRIIKIGNRMGDNAEMCMMELVDYNENLLTDKQTKAKTSRRRRGAGKKKVEDQVVAETAIAEETSEVVDETVTEQVAETKTEEVVVESEVVVEEKVEEKKEEPVVETKEETPKVETKEELKQEEKVEDKVEKPVLEVKEEDKKKEVPEAKVKDEKPDEEEKKDDSKQESK